VDAVAPLRRGYGHRRSDAWRRGVVLGEIGKVDRGEAQEVEKFMEDGVPHIGYIDISAQGHVRHLRAKVKAACNRSIWLFVWMVNEYKEKNRKRKEEEKEKRKKLSTFHTGLSGTNVRRRWSLLYRRY